MSARQLDQFYTSPQIAQRCFEKLLEKLDSDIKDTLFIEPSAGDGAFSDLLLNKCSFEALDIDPKKEYIKRQDFFQFEAPSHSRIVVVGNPPFGKNSSLALRFFNKSAEFAHLIAFVLPATFKKMSLQNKMDMNFHLIHEEDTPSNSFIFEGNSYDVPCVFQIWEKRQSKREAIITPKTTDFAFVNNALDCDIAFQRVGANAGKITIAPLCHDKNPNSHLFIKFRTKKIMHAFIKCDFTRHKLSTAGCPSISKSEILFTWNGVK